MLQKNTAIPFILSGNSKKLSIEKAEFLLSEVGLEKRLKVTQINYQEVNNKELQ